MKVWFVEIDKDFECDYQLCGIFPSKDSALRYIESAVIEDDYPEWAFKIGEEEFSTTIYIVMLNENIIAKIFDSRDKAEDYIREQKLLYPEIKWKIDAWRVF